MKKRQDMSPVQFLLTIFGIIAWVVTAYFAAQKPATVAEKGNMTAVAPNNVAAGGVLGFALAGGLCFLGAGMGERKGKDEETPPSPPA
jgi:hypothetical protein